LHFFL